MIFHGLTQKVLAQPKIHNKRTHRPTFTTSIKITVKTSIKITRVHPISQAWSLQISYGLPYHMAFQLEPLATCKRTDTNVFVTPGALCGICNSRAAACVPLTGLQMKIQCTFRHFHQTHMDALYLSCSKHFQSP